MRISVDLDDTILEYAAKPIKALQPLPGVHERFNEWKEQGHEITIFTSRNDSKYEEIKDWLEMNNIPFDRIICGKPFYDILIDDKASMFEGWDKDYING